MKSNQYIRWNMSSAIWIFYLLLWSHFAFACKFLRSVSILEANYLQKFNNPNYIHTLAGATQEISVNLTKLFQEELSEASNPAIYFTDAAESRPFVIRQAKDGSRFLVNEAPLDREDICNPFKFPDRVSVARKCCAKSAGEGIAAMHESSQRDLKCCMFLGITVEGYGTFALKIDVIDVNDNRPQFNVPADSLLIRPGKEDLFVIKITENTPQGTVIGLPRVVDLDEGKSADMLFQIEKVNSQMEWEQHFKLLSHVEDRCIPKLYEGLPSHRETDLPALCLLRTIDRETVAGFAFNLIARDQGEPVALSNTLSMTILVSYFHLIRTCENCFWSPFINHRIQGFPYNLMVVSLYTLWGYKNPLKACLMVNAQFLINLCVFRIQPKTHCAHTANRGSLLSSKLYDWFNENCRYLNGNLLLYKEFSSGLCVFLTSAGLICRTEKFKLVQSDTASSLSGKQNFAIIRSP